MASIDKIYGNEREYNEFKYWCIKNAPEVLKYFYKWSKIDWRHTLVHPLTNFPEKVDKWMLKYCSLDWVVQRIKEQYGEDVE